MRRQYYYKGTYVHFSIIFITLKISRIPIEYIPIVICHPKPFKFQYLYISKLDYII